MMKSLLLVLLSLFQIKGAALILPANQDQQYVDCEIHRASFILTDVDDEIAYRCILKDSQLAYDLPDWFVDKHEIDQNDGNIVRIHDTLAPTDVAAEELQIPKHAEIEFRGTADKMRRLDNTHSYEGERSILVVRVSTNDAEVDLTGEAIAQRIFGAGSETQTTPSATYEDCSFGKMRLNPAIGSSLIQNGVLELSLDTDIVGKSNRIIENLAVVATTAHLNLGAMDENFDHVVFCLPAGTNGVWTGYAYENYYRSVFNNAYCGLSSIVSHELGHNLGLAHSGEDGNSYGDQSGLMGYTYRSVGGPKMCFNAAKYWKLGWMQDKALSMEPSSSGWSGHLYAFVDYDKVPSGGVTILNVGPLYVLYNRRKDINSGTMERGDHVTVARAESTDNISELEGSLDLTAPTFSLENVEFRGKGNYTISFEVTDRVDGDPDYMDLKISFTSTQWVTQAPSSELLTESPTAAPSTNTPTIEPPIVTAAPETQAPTTPAPYRNPTTAIPTTQTPTPSISTKAPTALTPATQQPSLHPSTVGSFESTGNIFDNSNELGDEETFSPTAAPADHCDDDRFATFLVEETGRNEGCVWLAARPIFQSLLCSPSHPAYTACPETCNVCQDSCEDNDDGEFTHNGVVRNCLWLSLRNSVIDEICVPGHGAFSTCPETCDSCDRPIETARPSSISTESNIDNGRGDNRKRRQLRG